MKKILFVLIILLSANLLYAQNLSHFYTSALGERGMLYFILPTDASRLSHSTVLGKNLAHDFTFTVGSDSVRMLFSLSSRTKFVADSLIVETSMGEQLRFSMQTIYKKPLKVNKWDNRMEVILPSSIWKKLYCSSHPYTILIPCEGTLVKYGWKLSRWIKQQKNYQLLFDEIELNRTVK